MDDGQRSQGMKGLMQCAGDREAISLRQIAPRLHPVSSEPITRPKLNDICCSVLAMVLAMLAICGSMSAQAIEFMLVNCNESKTCARPQRDDDRQQRAGRDERKQADSQPDHDRVDCGHVAIAVLGEQLRGDRFDRHGGRGHRHHRQARLPGGRLAPRRPASPTARSTAARRGGPGSAESA